MPEEIEVISSKLAPPKYGRNIIDRKLLVTLLEEGSYRTLTLIQAPAGFGKTTLMMQVRKALMVRGKTVAWLTLDQSDDNVSTFVKYLVASLRYSGCDVGEGALAIYGRTSSNNHDNFVAALVNELEQCIQEIHLFIDDAYLLTDEGVTSILKQIINYAPDNFHLTLGSRIAPALDLTELRLHDQITEIDAAQLKFSFESATQYISNRLSIDIPEEEMRRLYDITDGWITGIQMAAIALSKSRNLARTISEFSSNSINVTTYLSTNIVDPLPELNKDFLLKTSILDRFNAELATAVTGIDESQAIIDEILRDNMFLLPMANAPRWYRYHSLFSDFLQHRLESEPESVRRELHQRAANWLNENNQLQDAIKHALYAGKTDLAQSLIEQHAIEMLFKGNFGQVKCWINMLPQEQAECSWEIQAAKALSEMSTNQPELAVETIAKTRQRFRSPEQLSQLKALESAVCNFQDDSTKALEICQQWQQISTLESFFEVSVGACSLAFGYLHAYQFEKAREALSLINRWHESELAETTVIYSTCFANLSLVEQGDLSRVANSYGKTLAKIEEHSNRRALLACMIAGLYAQPLYEMNQLEQVLAILANRLDVIEETCFTDSFIQAFLSYVRSKVSHGDINEALDTLDRMRTKGEARSLPRVIAVSLAELIRIQILRNDLATAETLLARLSEMAAPYSGLVSGTHAEIFLAYRLADCRYNNAIGDYEISINTLKQELTKSQRNKRTYLSAKILVLLVISHFKNKNLEDMTEHLLQALALGLQCGLVRSFLDEGKVMLDMLEHLNKINTPLSAELDVYTQSLIGEFNKQSTKTPDKRANDVSTRPIVFEELSKREHEILAMLTQGLPNKKVASIMNLSVDTVKWHLKNIYSKLGVGSRAQASDLARSHGLI